MINLIKAYQNKVDQSIEEEPHDDPPIFGRSTTSQHLSEHIASDEEAGSGEQGKNRDGVLPEELSCSLAFRHVERETAVVRCTHVSKDHWEPVHS